MASRNIPRPSAKAFSSAAIRFSWPRCTSGTTLMSPRARPSPKTCPTTAWESAAAARSIRSEEHTSELQSRLHLVCRLLLEKKTQPLTGLLTAPYLLPRRNYRWMRSPLCRSPETSALAQPDPPETSAEQRQPAYGHLDLRF